MPVRPHRHHESPLPPRRQSALSPPKRTTATADSKHSASLNDKPSIPPNTQASRTNSVNGAMRYSVRRLPASPPNQSSDQPVKSVPKVRTLGTPRRSVVTGLAEQTRPCAVFGNSLYRAPRLRPYPRSVSTRLAEPLRIRPSSTNGAIQASLPTWQALHRSDSPFCKRMRRIAGPIYGTPGFKKKWRERSLSSFTTRSIDAKLARRLKMIVRHRDEANGVSHHPLVVDR